MKAKASSSPARSSTRVSAEERARLIVSEAIHFFSEVGFNGSTRALAQRLGITQALLYKHFPNKQDLIDRVFREVFLERLDPGWKDLLTDRSRDLQYRLTHFYTDFRKVQFSAEWIRLYFFSALYDVGYNERWISIFEESVFPTICDEVRAYAGVPALDRAPLMPAEIEFVWSLHAAIFYHGVRKHLYRVKVYQDLETNVQMLIENFLASAASFYATHKPVKPQG